MFGTAVDDTFQINSTGSIIFGFDGRDTFTGSVNGSGLNGGNQFDIFELDVSNFNTITGGDDDSPDRVFLGSSQSTSVAVGGGNDWVGVSGNLLESGRHDCRRCKRNSARCRRCCRSGTGARCRHIGSADAVGPRPETPGLAERRNHHHDGCRGRRFPARRPSHRGKENRGRESGFGRSGARRQRDRHRCEGHDIDSRHDRLSSACLGRTDRGVIPNSATIGDYMVR
jgi:hypothetical protein